ncbi:caspase-1-like [Malaya genurostris]|uniref:caspase-1-like n=1 Tax=Malaya genurostris TaxID=325434 RepID=UPI0026F3B749|nr:caspase-1-like [Malaya genurostris]
MDPDRKKNVVMDFTDATGDEKKDATPTKEQPQDQVKSIPKRKGSTYVDTPLDPNSKQYSMNGGHRGKVLIFNQITFDDYVDRTGSNADVERLCHSLQRLGFRKEDISIFEDLGVSEIIREAIKLELDQDLQQSDCLMVIILTYGEIGDFVMAKNDQYHLFEFFGNFTPAALKSMAGKPKFFMVQTGPGRKRVKTLQTDGFSDRVDSVSETFIYPEFADLLVMISSDLGPSDDHGSWMIQEFCNVIDVCDLKTSSIYDILTETNDAVLGRISNADDDKDKTRQMPTFYSTLTKQLFFN